MTLIHRFYLLVSARPVDHVRQHSRILNVLKIQTTLHACLHNATSQNILLWVVHASLVTLVWNQLKITNHVKTNQTITNALSVLATGTHSTLRTTNVQTVINVKSQISPGLHASNHITTQHAWQAQVLLQHLPQYQLQYQPQYKPQYQLQYKFNFHHQFKFNFHHQFK